jgi:hypothetical protein
MVSFIIKNNYEALTKIELDDKIVENVEEYFKKIKSLKPDSLKNPDILDNIIFFGKNSVYSAQKGKITKKLADIKYTNIENFVLFDTNRKNLSAVFQTQTELLDHIFAIYNQMHVCLINYKSKSTIGRNGKSLFTNNIKI